MRIIGGNFRGKKILEPKDLKTRPLKDLTKESIFNILNHSNKFRIEIKNSIVLDLFSGVGSFGLECLSRGAKEVIFFENYNQVLPILKKNLSSLNLNKRYRIIDKDIFNPNNFEKILTDFDIIFLDAPFREKKLSILIEHIFKKKILKKQGIIIIHRHKKESETFSKNFKILDEKKYGISKVIFGKLD
tara:strand:+ start:23 stop:586 length:564 start_codon:yes stop_codon:yes gene_type:complete